MSTLENSWNPKQEILTDAIRELQMIKQHLSLNKTLKNEYVILKIDIVISLVKGVIFSS